MIDHGLLPSRMRLFLSATREPGWEYPRYSTDLLMSFFSDCLESIAGSGIDLEHVRLSLIYSRLADIQTIHLPDRCHIVFDQAYGEILDVMNRVFLEELENDSESGSADNSWARLVYANRLLSNGRHVEAALAAEQYARSVSRTKPSEQMDEKLYRWRQVQEAFVLGHEIAHCHTRDRQSSVAWLMAPEFGRVVKPWAKILGRRQNRSSARSDEDFVQGAVDELERSIGIAGGLPADIRSESEEYFRLVREKLENASRESLEEMLTRLVDGEGASGEEVLCDYLGASLAILNLAPTGILSLDECLQACAVASQHLQMWRTVDQFSKKPSWEQDGECIQTLAFELVDRHQSFTVSAMAIFARQLDRELRLSGVVGDDASAVFNSRVHDLRVNLNRTADAYVERFHPALTEGIATSAFLGAELLRTANGADKIPDISQVADVVAGLTGIGLK